MIHAASAYTFEIDDLEIALSDIQGQLAGKIKLRKHTVGILQCDPDFIESGVVAHICRSLEFPIVGGTSAGQATKAAAGDLMLTLLVLTSDDAGFSVVRTSGLANDLFGATERSYKEAQANLPCSPKLILAFPPIIEVFAGDWYVEAFERLCGKVPVFGSLAVDDTITNYDRCATICNGEIMSGEMAYLMICGDVAPQFFIATIPGESTLPETGIITKAKDNIVYEINGMRAMQYFEMLGLAENGVLHRGVDFVPFLMTINENDTVCQRPFVRALIRFEEDGSAVCRGTMYEGASFTLGSNSGADVLHSTLSLVNQINIAPEANVALMFSCIVRKMTLGADGKQELRQVQQAIRPGLEFMMAYSGGEIAPTGVYDNQPVNRFHNYSFIACIL